MRPVNTSRFKRPNRSIQATTAGSFGLRRSSIKATPSNHFPLVIESEHFDHTPATDTSIQNPNRVDSNMHINQLKLNRRNSCQADCPVCSNRRLPTQHAAGVYLTLDD